MKYLNDTGLAYLWDKITSIFAKKKDIVKVYNNVDDMKSDLLLSDGDVCETLGYYSVNDGGGATYVIHDTGTANDIDIINLNNGKIANLIYERIINVRKLGAKGDGAQDDSVIINRAISIIKPENYTDRKRGGIVFLPSGIYKIGNTISLPAYITLRGEGMYSTMIIAKSGFNKNMIETEGYSDFISEPKLWYDTSNVPTGFAIESLMLNGNLWNNTEGGGIRIYGYCYKVIDVAIYGSYGDAMICKFGGEDTFISNEVKMSESVLSNLHIYVSYGSGLIWDGGSDAKLDKIFIGDCFGINGLKINNSIDCGLIHVYGCSKSFSHPAVEINNNCRIDELISESNHGAGVKIDTYYANITKMQLYGNKQNNLIITENSKYIGIGELEIRINEENVSGVINCGNDIFINSMEIVAESCNSYGYFQQGGSNNTIVNSGVICGFNGDNGIGLALNQGGQNYGNKYKLHIINCKNCISEGSCSSGGDVLEILTETYDGQSPVLAAPLHSFGGLNTHNVIDRHGDVFTKVQVES